MERWKPEMYVRGGLHPRKVTQELKSIRKRDETKQNLVCREHDTYGRGDDHVSIVQ